VTERRERILAELDLGPRWRLRAPAVEAPAQPLAEAAPEAERNVGAASGAERNARIASLDWTPLRAEVLGCKACPLHAQRKQAVFGVGDQHAEWLLVGEAPGAEEDQRGEPFVGQAGRLLDNMLAALRLRRGENVYIANVLKCRPPGNRNPLPEEVACCDPFLRRQIELIQPRLVLALGRFAVQSLLATEASISSLRGRVHRYAGRPLVVTYHPAYLLRNMLDKAKAWEDLLLAQRVWRDAKNESGRGHE
jgi:DNA polymerase